MESIIGTVGVAGSKNPMHDNQLKQVFQVQVSYCKRASSILAENEKMLPQLF